MSASLLGTGRAGEPVIPPNGRRLFPVDRCALKSQGDARHASPLSGHFEPRENHGPVGLVMPSMPSVPASAVMSMIASSL